MDDSPYIRRSSRLGGRKVNVYKPTTGYSTKKEEFSGSPPIDTIYIDPDVDRTKRFKSIKKGKTPRFVVDSEICDDKQLCAKMIQMIEMIDGLWQDLIIAEEATTRAQKKEDNAKKAFQKAMKEHNNFLQHLHESHELL